MTDGLSEPRLSAPSVVTCNSRGANRGGAGQFRDVMTPQTASTEFSTAEIPDNTTCRLMSEGEAKPKATGVWERPEARLDSFPARGQQCACARTLTH